MVPLKQIAIYMCAIIQIPITPIQSLSISNKQPSNPVPPSPTTPTTRQRRAFLRTVVGTAATTALTTRNANAATTQQQQPPLILPRPTAIATLNLSINRSPTTRPLRIELYGDETPSSVAFFTALASGTLRAPCSSTSATAAPGSSTTDTTDDSAAASTTTTSSETCLEYQETNVGYANSQVWRLVPDRRIDFGRVDSIFSGRVPPTIPIETRRSSGGGTIITPSTRGAVSIRRGGGAFEFTIAPPTPSRFSTNLDTEDLVVVGKVMDDGESMAFLDELYSIPTRKDIIGIGDVPPLGDGNLKRACEFTSPSKTCAQFKPLKRIVVVGASVEAL